MTLASITGELCIDAAGIFPSRTHEYPPGHRVFSDITNKVIDGDNVSHTFATIPSESVVGMIDVGTTMTIRTAKIVIAIQAALIVGFVIVFLVSDDTGQVRPPLARGGSSTEAELESPRPGEPRVRKDRPTVSSASRPDTEGVPITSNPYVEENVAWSEDDPVGIVLYGKVTTQDGKPAKEDLYVSLEDDETGEWKSSGAVKGGSYAVTGLKPGGWTVNIRATGYREIRQPLQLTASAPRQRLDLVIQPCAIVKVKIVTPEGQLIGDALRAEKFEWNLNVRAVATLTPPTGDLPLTPYSGHDDFGVGILRGGGNLGGDVPKGYSAILELREGPPVYVSAVLRHVILETKLVPAGADEVVLAISTDAVKRRLATVRLQLVDADSGASIPKGSVNLTDRQSSGMPYPVDADGRLVKENLRPGLLHLSIHVPDYEGIHQYVRLESGGVTDLGTIRMNRAVSIEGLVVDAQGKPVAASLSYRNLDRMDFPQPLDVEMGYNVESDGSFKIAGAGRGRGLLTARTKDRAVASAVVDTASGSVANARVVFKKSTPVVIDPQMNRHERYLFSITDEEGTPWHASYPTGPWPIRLTVPPGTYTLRIYDDKSLKRTHQIIVGSTPVRMSVNP